MIVQPRPSAADIALSKQMTQITLSTFMWSVLAIRAGANLVAVASPELTEHFSLTTCLLHRSAVRLELARTEAVALGSTL